MRLALVVALTGCHRLFALDDIEPSEPDASEDLACEDYDLELFAGARYRIIEAEVTAWAASDDCGDDTPGRTHLAVLDTRAELDAIRSALQARTALRWWIGAVQPTTETTNDGGWIWLTGATVAADLWSTSPVLEPNDGDGTENKQEQFAAVQKVHIGVVDYGGSNGEHALCECDGMPITTEARVAIDQGRL